MRYRETIEKLAKEHHFEDKVKDLYSIFESFDQMNDLFKILQSDAKRSDSAVKLNPTDQYLRRTLVRTHFAMIEGLLNVLNQTVLDAYRGGFIQLSTKEFEKLSETRIKNGETILDFMSINKKVPFSFGIYARKLGGIEYSIDVISASWRQFDDAVRIRNRLMHPRKPDDMVLYDKEISLILDVTSWFLTLHIDLLQKVGDAIAKKTVEKLSKARIKGIQAGK